MTAKETVTQNKMRAISETGVDIVKIVKREWSYVPTDQAIQDIVRSLEGLYIQAVKDTVAGIDQRMGENLRKAF